MIYIDLDLKIPEDTPQIALQNPIQTLGERQGKPRRKVGTDGDDLRPPETDHGIDRMLTDLHADSFTHSDLSNSDLYSTSPSCLMVESIDVVVSVIHCTLGRSTMTIHPEDTGEDIHLRIHEM